MDCLDSVKNYLKGDDKCFSNKSSAKEKGKEFSIYSESKKEEFCRIKVDGCLIESIETKKCDFVFVRCSTNDFYFVELKGRSSGNKLNDAYDQIKQTILYFKEHLKIDKKQIFGFIITNSLPRVANQRFIILKERFVKELGFKLINGTNKIIHRV